MRHVVAIWPGPEARRKGKSSEPMTRQKELEREGWERKNTIDEPRLSELADNYRQLGYEVHFEPVHLDDEIDCAECLAEHPDRFRTIYVRRATDR